MTRGRRTLSGTLAKYFGDAGEEPIEHWPAERIAAYQRDAIAEQLAHVYQNNAFYRKKFADVGVTPDEFHTLDDLRRFPLTSKDELRGDPWTLLSVPKNEVCLAHTSYLLYSWDDMYAGDQLPAPRLLMPVRETDVVIDALPYEMSSSGQSFQRCLQGMASALVVPVGKGGFYSDPYKTVQIMAELQASVLITTPPYAMLLSEVAQQLGLRLDADIRLRFIWLTGEGCSPAYRRRLEELWHCQGLIFYGSMECGSVGIECAKQAGGHVSLGQVYVEIVDPKTGQPLPAGEVGEVVCTVLQRKASPLIRFRSQDLGYLDTGPCPCGVRFPRLHIRGRIVDQVSGEGVQQAGPPISPYAIEEVLYRQPELGGNYQIYTAGPKLLIDAELRSGVSVGEPAKTRIEHALVERGLPAEVRWIEHIPRTGGKTRRLRPLGERDEVMKQTSMLKR
jgi:phenylacetate-CoA ligase